MKFKPEDFDKIRAKKLAVAIRRLNSEKPLTASQERLLAEEELAVRSGVNLAATSEHFVGTWDELAAALGKAINGTVTRRAVQEWRTDPRYQPEIERRRDLLERADGRHCVSEWVKLMVDLNLKRGGAAGHVKNDLENESDESGEGILKPPPVAGSTNDWNRAIAALDHRKKENAIGVQEGRLIVAAELEVPLGATFAVFQSKLSMFPGRVARYLVGMRDPGEVEDKLRDELDADLGELQAAAFVETSIESVLASLPFDEESTRLLQLVTFDGQDAIALRELIARVAVQALRLIGRQALAGSDAPSEPSAKSAVSDAAALSPPLIESQNNEPPNATADAGNKVARKPARGPSPKSKAAPPESKKRRKKARPEPAKAPPEVEAAIASVGPAKKTRRRRQ